MTDPKTARANNAFFYGYVIVMAAFIVMFAYSAARSVLGVFFKPMANELGWNSAVMSGALSLSVIMDGVLGIFWGRITDRLGPRKVLTVCSCLVALAFILMSRISTVWQMYLVFGVLNGIGMGGIYVPIISNISRWFVARRSTMNGLVLAGTGLGTLFVAPVTNWLILTYDWRHTYIILGIAFLIFMATPSQFMKLDPSQTGQVPYDKPRAGNRETKPEAASPHFTEVLRQGQFWLIFLGFFCFGYYAFSIMLHIVPHAIHLNISGSTAANILAVIGGTSMLGRLAFGEISDKIGNKRAYGLGFIMVAATLSWLIFIGHTWMFFLFAVIFGFSQGGMSTVQAPIVAELFGLKSHGMIFGACGVGLTLGGSVGPLLTGYLFDVTGGYQSAFIACALVAVAGIVITVLLIRNKGGKLLPGGNLAASESSQSNNGR